MMSTATLAAVVLLFLLAAWGWGRMTRPFCDRRIFTLQSLTAILGLAALNVVGGVLNLLSLARTWALVALLGIGLVAAVRELLRVKPWRGLRCSMAAIPLGLAAALAAIPCVLLAPGGVFNIHDDFHTYATRAVRMTQTGSVGGNPFDPLGLDSLGSQSFFHGFFLAGHDLRLLNGFDAIACFALGLLLLAELAWRWRLPWWAGVSAILALAAINAQCVNVSPVYSGVAAILALVVCGAFWSRALLRGQRGRPWRAVAALALLAAWLGTLKITLAAFGALYLGGLGVLLLARAAPRAVVLRAAARLALLAAVLMLPWLLVSFPTLLKARQVAGKIEFSGGLAGKHPSLTERRAEALLQPGRLWYGNTALTFLALGLAGTGLALLSLVRSGRNPATPSSAALASVSAAGAALLPMLVLHAHLFPIGSAVRYSCPILIGGFLAVSLGFLRFGSGVGGGRRRALAATVTVCHALFIAAFASNAADRLQRASRDHTLLAFPLNRYFTAYSRAMSSGAETDYASRLQEHLPAGATTLVWTVAPFQFDFARNPLLTLSEPGLINPALRFPAGATPGQLADYFRAHGIRYVLFETNAYGIKELDELAALSRSRHAVERKLGDYGAYLRQSLTALAAQGPARFSDDRMVLFELKEPAAPRAATTAQADPRP